MLSTRSLVLPIPFTLIWMMMVNRFALDSLIMGYLLSFFIMQLVVSTQDVQGPARLRGFHLRIWAFLVYVILLWVEIFFSGLDVALRVLGLRPITRSGIVAVPIQDENNDPVIAGLSAHAITITPGEMVVAYDPDEQIMYVHCLDVEMSAPTLDERQAKRVKMFRRILNDRQ